MENRNVPGAAKQPQQHGNSSDGLSDQAARLTALSAELQAHRDQLRNYEKELVERIADVDDDRRRNATQLKRVWQSQCGEIYGRLRRQAIITATSLVLLAAGVAVALFIMHRGNGLDRNSITNDITKIQQDLAQISQIGARDELQVKLAQLNTNVEEISSSLVKLTGEQQRIVEESLVEERVSREHSNSRLEKDLRRLEVEQRRIVQEFELLRKALEVVQAADVAPNPGDGVPTRSTPVSAEDVDAATVDLVSEQSGSTTAVGTDSVAEMPIAGAATGSDPDGSASDSTKDAGSEGSGSAVRETVVVGDRPYAIQLIGFFTLQSLLDFSNRDDLPARVYFREETYRERPWYVMIHSLHGSYESAAEELLQLSADLAGLDPWIRTMKKETELEVLQIGASKP